MRTACICHTDLTDFVPQPVLREAARIEVSGRDYARVVALLEDPPAPNAKIRAAAAALPRAE